MNCYLTSRVIIDTSLSLMKDFFRNRFDHAAAGQELCRLTNDIWVNVDRGTLPRR